MTWLRLMLFFVAFIYVNVWCCETGYLSSLTLHPDVALMVRPHCKISDLVEGVRQVLRAGWYRDGSIEARGDRLACPP